MTNHFPSPQMSIIQSKSVLKRPKANVLFTVVTHKDQVLPIDSVASFPVVWVSLATSLFDSVASFPFVWVSLVMPVW